MPRDPRKLTTWILALASMCLVLGGLLFGSWAFQRYLLGNFHAVVPGQVYRSAQPSARQLARWVETHEIRTVVNLRGRNNDKPLFRDELRVLEEMGVNAVVLRFGALDLPPRHHLLELMDTLNSAPRPLLIHCEAGADRTGLASVMAAMAVGGQSYQQALSQISLQYLHVMSRDRHMGGMLRQYEAWCAQEGLDTAGWERFCSWARTEYSVGYYRFRIVPPRNLQAQPNEEIALDVTITNLSNEALPITGSGEQFRLVVFTRQCRDGYPVDTMVWAPIEGPDIKPGQSRQISCVIRAPAETGRHTLKLDMVGSRWFSHKGSPLAEMVLDVGNCMVAAPGTAADQALQAGPTARPAPTAPVTSPASFDPR